MISFGKNHFSLSHKIFINTWIQRLLASKKTKTFLFETKKSIQIFVQDWDRPRAIFLTLCIGRKKRFAFVTVAVKVFDNDSTIWTARLWKHIQVQFIFYFRHHLFHFFKIHIAKKSLCYEFKSFYNVKQSYVQPYSYKKHKAIRGRS